MKFSNWLFLKSHAFEYQTAYRKVIVTVDVPLAFVALISI
jgi:hypothetical protein